MSSLFEWSQPTRSDVLGCYLLSLCESGYFDTDKNESEEKWAGMLLSDVRSEIDEVWLPLFRKKGYLELALCVVRDGYDEMMVSDVAALYLEVLSSSLAVGQK
jgi:hypothetical protein